MKKSLLLLAALSAIIFTQKVHGSDSLIEETVKTTLPMDETGKWKSDSRKIHPSGRIVNVWSKKNEFDEDERIVVVSTPYKNEIPSIKRAIESALFPVRLQLGASWEIVQQNDREAIIKWKIKDEKTALCKLILGSDALHSLSYIYQGKHASRMDQNKWTTFLKYASLQTKMAEDICKK